VRELVVGCQGYIGAKLMHLSGAEGASHGNPNYHPYHLVDLKYPLDPTPPQTEIAYICAGINGAQKCEGNAEAYRINVDGTVELAKHYTQQGTFVVWISSRSLEWSTSAYARQKQIAEAMLYPLGVGIVRAGRVTADNVDDLCATLMEVGRGRIGGLTIWGTDDIAYSR
jgi:hypothetical protein